jgi:hypothetical protein
MKSRRCRALGAAGEHRALVVRVALYRNRSTKPLGGGERTARG